MNKKISALPVAPSPLNRTAPLPTVIGGITVQTNANDICGLYQVKIPISAAAVATISTTPIVAITAPGVGYAIRPIAVSCRIIFNTIVYNTNIDLSIYNPTSNNTIFSILNALNANVNRHKIGTLDDPNFAADTQIMENDSLNITCPSGDPISGNSDIIVYITYEILAL